MVKFSKNGVSLSNLWVSRNDRLSDFYASSWQRGDSPVPLLVVRVILAACGVGILTWSLIEGASPYWLIYLTNWGILFVAATTISGLLVSLVFVSTKKIESTHLPWYVSLYWLMFNISVPLSILITALYWILLYDPAIHEEMGVRFFWLDITTHGFTSCVLLVELLVSRTPVRVAHIYQSLGIGLWYAAFSGIYYVAGGTDKLGNPFVYEVLDWRQGTRAAIVVVGAAAALLVLYMVLWVIAWCRDKISLSFVRTTSHNLPFTPADQNQQIV